MRCTSGRGLGLVVAFALPSCISPGEVEQLQQDLKKARPYLPEPAGTIADVGSLVLAALAAKKASSARRRATRRTRRDSDAAE